MKKIIKQYVFLFFIVALLISAFFLHQSQVLTLENLKLQRDFFDQYVAENYTKALIIFVLFYSAETALALPGTLLLTLLGGYLFGIIGFFLSIFSAVLGASITFLSVRSFFGPSLYKKYKNHWLLASINDELKAHPYSYLLFLRLVPFFPFFLINILLGLTDIPFITFVWTTLLGIAPGDFLYTVAGKELSTLSSFRDVFSWRIIILFGILIGASLLPILMRRRRKVD